ncbi:MAG: GNAT family N-acetyltransferase [Bradymonadaceae bacterium]
MGQHGDVPIIERPGPEDAAAMGQLFFEDMQDLGIETSVEAQSRLARSVIEAGLSEPPLCISWVARLAPDGEAVGVALANFNFSLKFAGPSLWIEELYVTPRARRRGIGRLLVEKILNYAEAEGIQGIDLEAYQGNTPASILYRSLGFYRLGRERFYYRLGPQEYL